MAMPKISINKQILALSFILAVGLWYVVTVRERQEVRIEVALHYRSLPENLAPVERPQNNFSVVLRGPKELIRSLNTKTLTTSVDLSSLRKGSNVIPLSAPAELLNSRAIDVLGLFPGQLVIEAESVLERTVPLQPKFAAPALAQALKAEKLRVEPAEVVIRGPESVIRRIAALPLEVPLDPAAAIGEHGFSSPVVVPARVICMTGTVRARYTVAGRRVVVEMERAPVINQRNAPNCRMHPPKVLLRVEMPEGFTENRNYLDKIRVLVGVQHLAAGASAGVRPSVELPEGSRLLGITPAELTVTINGK